jgi:hypothetical protein
MFEEKLNWRMGVSKSLDSITETVTSQWLAYDLGSQYGTSVTHMESPVLRAKSWRWCQLHPILSRKTSL